MRSFNERPGRTSLIQSHFDDPYQVKIRGTAKLTRYLIEQKAKSDAANAFQSAIEKVDFIEDNLSSPLVAKRAAA